MPHFHISGIHGVIVFLFVVAVFGAAHLAAASNPDNRLAQGWISLGF
jgi:hypothetical protein